jgi:hypothetical protein
MTEFWMPGAAKHLLDRVFLEKKRALMRILIIYLKIV